MAFKQKNAREKNWFRVEWHWEKETEITRWLTEVELDLWMERHDFWTSTPKMVSQNGSATVRANCDNRKVGRVTWCASEKYPE